MRWLFLGSLLAISNVLPQNSSRITLLLTSNLQGEFDLESSSDSTMLRLMESILAEKESVPDAEYFDLGNSFFPGAISRFSLGSTIADFFETAGARSVLLSSKDLQIGAYTLNQLQKSRKFNVLSANLKAETRTYFKPFITITMARKKIVFVGLSSSQSTIRRTENQL